MEECGEARTYLAADVDTIELLEGLHHDHLSHDMIGDQVNDIRQMCSHRTLRHHARRFT